MNFIIPDYLLKQYEQNTVILIKDNWNDFGFNTMFSLKYSDGRTLTDIGPIRIGKSQMQSPDDIKKYIPVKFEKLDTEFFSISYDIEYYKNLFTLPNDKGYEILRALNDFIVRPEIFEIVKDQTVTTNSLLRDTTPSQRQEYIEERRKLMTPPIKLSTVWHLFGSTGWDNVDNALFSMQKLLYSNDHRYFFNAIAVIGREIIKALTNENYNDETHRDKTQYPTAPTEDQYIAKLSGIVDHLPQLEFASKEIKKHIKTTIELVEKFVHKDDIKKNEMYICVDAVISLIFQLSFICNPDKCR